MTAAQTLAHLQLRQDLEKSVAHLAWPCGHPRTPENTQRIGDAGVRCRICRRVITLRSYHKRKAAGKVA